MARPYLLQLLIRSPHPHEVFLSYGVVHLVQIYLTITYLNEGIAFYIKGLFLGGFVYTFIEYWFHREFLHNWVWDIAHAKHHQRPNKLSIIATPVIPVQIYEIGIMMTLSAIFDVKTAILTQIGISISQVIMDITHIIEHTAYNPWWMKSMRMWHHHHHDPINEDVGHGLTSSFWDLIFGTLPNNYELYLKYPYLKLFGHLPFPLIGFVLTTPWLYTLENIKPKGSVKRMYEQIPSWKELKLKWALPSFISGFVVGLSPFLTNQIVMLLQ